MIVVELGIGDGDGTGPPTRAELIEDIENLGMTADAAMILPDATTESHAAVASARHEDDGVAGDAAGVERFPHAVLAHHVLRMNSLEAKAPEKCLLHEKYDKKNFFDFTHD